MISPACSICIWRRNIGSGTGESREGQWPLHFLDWGAWPLHFFDRQVKNADIRHAVKCLTWWKIVHQIASFKHTFSKKLQLLRGHIPPQTPPCISQALRPLLMRHFLLSKFWPPTLKIVPPPMRRNTWPFQNPIQSDPYFTRNSGHFDKFHPLFHGKSGEIDPPKPPILTNLRTVFVLHSYLRGIKDIFF